jgi:hypothetical protein
MRFGFTVAWVGWDSMSAPILSCCTFACARDEQGKSITGVVRATFTPSARTAE